MSWKEWTAAILAGALGAILGFLSKRLERRDKKEDEAAAAEAADEAAAIAADDERRNDAAAQVEELRQETSEQFAQIRQETADQFAQVDKRIVVLDRKLDANTQGTQAQLFNTINHLGNKYIGKGPYIEAADLRGIVELWNAYKINAGDPSLLTDGPLNAYEYLSRVMDEVFKLRIKNGDNA